MSFNAQYLGKADLNFAESKQWVYDASSTGADDTIAEINTDGYFNDAWNDLEVNDRIHVIASDGHFLVYVNNNDYDEDAETGSVDITDGLQVTATDSD